MRPLERDPDKRAVTAFFRVFGRRPEVPPGDLVVRAAGEGLHGGECRTLAVLVPLVAGAAVLDGLWRLGGAWLAWAGVLPVTFLGLQVLAFLTGGLSPRSQWRRWAVLLTLWAGWLCWSDPLSGVGWAAALWLVAMALNLAARACLLWRSLMESPRFCRNGFRVLLAVLVQVASVGAGWRFGWGWTVASQVLLGSVWACGTFLPNSRVFGPVCRRVEGPGALLSIDDGPDPADTPALLDLLDRHGERAVFFVIGDKVRRYPELAREIVRRGHELGNHTMTHPAGSMWCAGPVRTRREIVECSRAIEEVTGVKPRWFRAPAGHRNWFTHPVLREEGLELVGWKKRAFDAVRRDVPWIVKRLTTDVRDGDIILLHEATPIAKEVMEGVLEGLSSK